MSENKVHQPNDKYFKRSISIPEVAKDFVSHYLPQLKERYKLRDLKPVKGTFIDSKFAQTETDILFEAKCGKYDVYLYVLVEQQTEPEQAMPFRMMKYMLRIVERDLELGKKKVPVILPAIFYTGTKEWKYSTDFLDLFSGPRELAEQAWREPFKLIQASHVDLPRESKIHPFSAMLSWVMSHIQDRNFIKKFEQEAIRYLTTDNALFFENTFSYIINKSDATFSQFEDLLFKHADSEIGEKMRSVAEQLEKIGEARGEARGKAEGQAEEKMNVAQNLLKKGSDPEFVAEITELPVSDINNLLKKLKKSH